MQYVEFCHQWLWSENVYDYDNENYVYWFILKKNYSCGLKQLNSINYYTYL